VVSRSIDTTEEESPAAKGNLDFLISCGLFYPIFRDRQRSFGLGDKGASLFRRSVLNMETRKLAIITGLIPAQV
jgi:hypothetical protein